MSEYLNCVPCFERGDHTSPATTLAIQVYGENYHFLPVCDNETIDWIDEDNEEQFPDIKFVPIVQADLPFTVGVTPEGEGFAPMLGRFSSKRHAEEFIDSVLFNDDADGVEAGKYYLDGPEFVFEVKPMTNSWGKEGWAIVDQDGDAFGWWEDRATAEGECQQLNKVVQ